MTIMKSTLAENIVKILIRDERTKNSAIEVMDHNGVITLKGTANSDEARDAAKDIAESHEGVVSVTNDIEVDHKAIAEGVPALAPAVAAPNYPA